MTNARNFKTRDTETEIQRNTPDSDEIIDKFNGYVDQLKVSHAHDILSEPLANSELPFDLRAKECFKSRPSYVLQAKWDETDEKPAVVAIGGLGLHPHLGTLWPCGPH